MRTLISAVAGFALLTGVVPHRAVAAEAQTPQPQRAVFVTAGQGGSMTIVLPPAAAERANAGPAQALALTAGQAGSITVVVPGPSVDVVAAKAPANGASRAQMTLLPTEGTD